MTRFVLLAFLLLASVGCAATEAAIKTAESMAVGGERYYDLATSSFAGGTSLEVEGIASVSTADLAKTPASVRGMLGLLLESLHANRVGANSILFQLDGGPDPATLDLKPVAMPAVKGENADLLGDN